MSEWKDWLSNSELSSKVRNSICSIEYDRLERFAEAIESAYPDDWMYQDFAECLRILNKSIRSMINDTDYIWVIDCWENDGWFEPNKEDFMDCIQRVSKLTGIQF